MSMEKQSKLLYLNVGGVYYTTTVDTLTKVKDSMLAVMFSGNYSFTLDNENRIFIDRNGSRFKYVLDFLRDGEFECEKEIKRNLIIKELIYFGLISKGQQEEEKQIKNSSKSLIFAGFAQWEHNSYVQTPKQQEELMKEAAAKYYNGSRPLTILEYLSTIEIKGLPETNTSSEIITFLGPCNLGDELDKHNHYKLKGITSSSKLDRIIYEEWFTSGRKSVICVIEQ